MSTSTTADPDLPPSTISQRRPLVSDSERRTHTKPKIAVVPVRESELPGLARIYMNAYRGMEQYGEPSLDKAIRYLRQLYRSCPQGFFKARIRGKTAGFIACDPHWLEPGRGKVMEVHELVADPQWQGYGIGGRLLRFAFDYGRTLGRRTLSLWAGEGNTKALSWYRQKFGFATDRKAGVWVHLHRGIDAPGYA
jgi:ribosomal protein S18 acetylase RimI-like enzyme